MAAAARAREQAQLEDLEAMTFTSPAMAVDSSAAASSAAGVSAAAESASPARLLSEDLKHVQFHDTPEALLAAMAQPTGSWSRAVVMIAAPTSGWTAISAYMQVAHDLVRMYKETNAEVKLRIVILPGARFDVIANVQETKGQASVP